ncbi:putative DNA mismatch repair protein MSH4-like [Capsicum annuum]|nr:putative DNA mismatch repair protein MSH4-like [Capsicum annuum]KAF3668194.1 putative DNA mismatch repair protein MSH4-like [Capsicum annuum]
MCVNAIIISLTRSDSCDVDRSVSLPNEMRKFLRRIIVVLLFRVSWKKLFVIGTILTVFRIIFQIYSLPNPLTGWIISPPLVVSSYQRANDGKNSRELSVTSDNQLKKSKHLPAVVSVNSTARNSREVSVTSDNKLKMNKHLAGFVSLNSTARTNRSMQVLQRRERHLRRRRSKMNAHLKIIFPPPPVVPDHVQRSIAALKPNEALAYAKSEIEKAPLITDDPDLYAPLFRNVSVFKRSYELMELLLKVYIYKEGERPIFHEPHLTGIYSSEGWFMKLMEQNRYFVTRDPEKAHLFYLPYSSRQLQMAVYVPNSHNLRPLSIFLRDYVNMLAAKYPFWNRTHGTDHFLVACHDWGPYILKDHKELIRNTIKALCNADISEGIFKAGKDVSLPETTIRNVRKPLRNVGGKRVSQRPILAFFAGNMHGPVRPKLLKYWKDRDEDMKIYGPLPTRVSRIMSYAEHMKSSKYCLCPMGFEVNSPRIVESIYYECVPVIIADNLALPFDEVLDWSAFSLTVAEKDIPKLKEILLSIPLKRYQVMQHNVKKLQKHFHWKSMPTRYDLFHMILHSIWSRRLNQLQESQIS